MAIRQVVPRHFPVGQLAVACPCPPGRIARPSPSPRTRAAWGYAAAEGACQAIGHF